MVSFHDQGSDSSVYAGFGSTLSDSLYRGSLLSSEPTVASVVPDNSEEPTLTKREVAGCAYEDAEPEAAGIVGCTVSVSRESPLFSSLPDRSMAMESNSQPSTKMLRREAEMGVNLTREVHFDIASSSDAFMVRFLLELPGGGLQSTSHIIFIPINSSPLTTACCRMGYTSLRLMNNARPKMQIRLEAIEKNLIVDYNHREAASALRSTLVSTKG